jgi:hypothetical protein
MKRVLINRLIENFEERINNDYIPNDIINASPPFNKINEPNNNIRCSKTFDLHKIDWNCLITTHHNKIPLANTENT